MAEIEKYNPLWLLAQNKDAFLYKVRLQQFQQAIDNCKMPILKFIIQDSDHLEEISSILFKYKFDYKLGTYYSWPMNELTIYLK